MFIELMNRKVKNPVIIICDSNGKQHDEHLNSLCNRMRCIITDGFGDGICLGMTESTSNKFQCNKNIGKQLITNSLIQLHSDFTGNKNKDFKNRIYFLSKLWKNFI